MDVTPRLHGTVAREFTGSDTRVRIMHPFVMYFKIRLLLEETQPCNVVTWYRKRSVLGVL